MVSPADFGKRPKNPELKKIEYENVDFRKIAEEERALAQLSQPASSLVEQSCIYCEKTFQRNKGNLNHVTCSKSCRKKAKRLELSGRVFIKANCLICQSEFRKYSDDEENVACSYECRQKVKELRKTGHLPLTKRDAAVEEQARLDAEERLKLHEEVMATMYREISEKKFAPRTTEENLRKVRQWQAKANEFDFLCPNPLKRVYRTWEEAEAFILEAHTDDHYIHPYVCRCGAIHIGHSNGYGTAPVRNDLS